MNTHQKVFFTCAVTLGVLASAFASSPAPTAAVAVIELPRATVVGHRDAPEISLERSLVVGHRNDVLVASSNSGARNT
jgi:hypothetical protein